MQVQQGVVKYKDRSDIVCTYGITDDGKQFYFLDDKPLENGNLVVSSSLVEAIDPLIMASHVGVIDAEGKVVIPLENKSVKNVNNVLLVERATPTTPSVLEAINLKNDPLSAAKLVTTPATIKDKISNKMSPEGRFVFNDQFSEATVYDLNGQNLVNDDYFSFIAVTSDKMYLCKNTTDSEILEYSLFPKEVTQNDDKTDSIKVEDVAVKKEEIEKAISDEMDIQEKNINNEVKGEEEKVTEEKKQDALENEEMPLDKMPEEDSQKDEINKEEKKEEEINLDKPLENDTDSKDTQDNKQEEDESETMFTINFDVDDEKDKIDDKKVFGDSILSDDKIVDINAEIKSNEIVEGAEDSNIIEDVTKSISSLIALSRKQQEKIDNYEQMLKDKDDNKDKELNDKIKNYETIVQKLENRNHELDDKVTEQARIIESQEKELKALRPQVESRGELLKLLADANNLLNESGIDNSKEEKPKHMAA